MNIEQRYTTVGFNCYQFDVNAIADDLHDIAEDLHDIADHRIVQKFEKVLLRVGFCLGVKTCVHVDI